MKKSVIKDIFHGFRGNVETMTRAPETKKYAGLVSDSYDELIKRLSPEILEYHQKFVDALESNFSEEVDFFFCEGFKLGLLIGLEVMESEE